MKPLLNTAAAGAAILLVAASGVHSVPATAHADDAAPISLPTPTGDHHVGTTLLHLVDDGRPDPLSPDGGERELMAQLWYPATDTAGRPPARYLTDQEAAIDEQAFALPPGSLTGVPTNSHLDAPVDDSAAHPLVLFYPGTCGNRADSTIVAEELASRGYVVAATSSTHESFGVEFPDGEVATPEEGTCGSVDPELVETLTSTRVADTRFLLDVMAELNAGAEPDASGGRVPAGMAGSLDLERIGMYGHSLGGSTVASTMLVDDRIDAGLNFDGQLDGEVIQAGLDRPYLMIGSEGHTEEADPTWAEFRANTRGWEALLRITGTGHYRFVDKGGSTEQWDLRAQFPSEQAWAANFGDIADDRAMEILREYTVAYFDRFLRDQPAPILDGPSAAHPEVIHD